MPVTVPVPGGRPSRRAVLQAGLGLPVLATALVGCTTTPDAPVPPPEPDPDVALTEQAADRERSLLAAYDAALSAVPALADRLAPLRAEHAEHLAVLGAQDATPSPSATPSPAAPSPPAPSPAAPSPTAPSPTAPGPAAPATPPPVDPAAALASLAEAERAASARHGDAAVLAGRALAGVLASLAASEASHPVALG